MAAISETDAPVAVRRSDQLLDPRVFGQEAQDPTPERPADNARIRGCGDHQDPARGPDHPQPGGDLHTIPRWHGHIKDGGRGRPTTYCRTANDSTRG